MGSAMQSEVVTEFFVRGKGMEFNTGLAAFTAMSAPLYMMMILMPFYKSLADKYGRKLFLVLNTVGMGIGLGICMNAGGPLVYICGMLVINFVMYNDMQVMYVMECAPRKAPGQAHLADQGGGAAGRHTDPCAAGYLYGG